MLIYIKTFKELYCITLSYLYISIKYTLKLIHWLSEKSMATLIKEQCIISSFYRMWEDFEISENVKFVKYGIKFSQ